MRAAAPNWESGPRLVLSDRSDIHRRHVWQSDYCVFVMVRPEVKFDGGQPSTMVIGRLSLRELRVRESQTVLPWYSTVTGLINYVL